MLGIEKTEFIVALFEFLKPSQFSERKEPNKNSLDDNDARFQCGYDALTSMASSKSFLSISPLWFTSANVHKHKRMDAE